MQEAPAESPRRPTFARDFPRDPQLDALVAAFEAGDFARVRDDGRKLLATATDDAVKRAASTLIARTGPDPLAAGLVVVAALLLVALSAWWITHDGPAAPNNAPPPKPKIEIER